MSAGNTPLTPAQVLRLVAEYAEAAQKHDHAVDTAGDHSYEGDMWASEDALRDLDPALIRAQAAALAEREAECERLRKALTGASTALRLTEPEHGVPEYQAAQQHALRFIHAALTPTQEAQP